MLMTPVKAMFVVCANESLCSTYLKLRKLWFAEKQEVIKWRTFCSCEEGWDFSKEEQQVTVLGNLNEKAVEKGMTIE